MTSLRLLPTPAAHLDRPDEPPGAGLLTCERGNLPLVAMTVVADITGLLASMTIRQTFANPHESPIEAAYIFPLPDRAAVTAFTVTMGNRLITGVIQERQEARDAYDDALAAGHLAALLEEDRPDVFTSRLGNLAPGEEATVELTLAGPVPWEFDEATFRVPLVVAPRYIPGLPLDGFSSGQGTGLDTDAVPDASRITPPLLVPGSAAPVRLALTVRLDPGGLAVRDLRSNLHAAVVSGELPSTVTIEVQPGERLNRDFILRYRVAGAGDKRVTALAIPDPVAPGGSEAEEGTWTVTMLPPTLAATAPARDVLVLLDRSGSMGGWKMVAARRAAARIIDSLTGVDRFALIAFDDRIEYATGLTASLVDASDRNRYHAVEWLGRLEARGGTELAAALRAAHGALAPCDGADRARCCIVVTDGQVGDEDQLVRLAGAAEVRTFTVGIDQAVNAGLLRRLAAVTGGRCDLVESEERLDGVLTDLQRRIGHPVLESVTVRFEGLAADTATVTPDRHPDLYPGVPLVISGRYRGRPGGRAIVSAADARTRSVDVVTASTPAAAAVWARAHLGDLEDRYAALSRSAAAGQETDHEALAARIVAVSLRHRVLCRFTAWVAVDQSGERVEGDGRLHRIVQPVEVPAGWSAASRAVHWMGAPLGAPLGAQGGGGQDVATPAPVPYRPQPGAAPGTRPPIRMAGPNTKPRRRLLRGRPAQSAPAATTLAPAAGAPTPGAPTPGAPTPGAPTTRAGAAPVPGAPAPATPATRPPAAPGPATPAPDTFRAYRRRLAELVAAIERLGDRLMLSDRRPLAADARTLAADIASVTLECDLVGLLESLAAALVGGDETAIAAAVAGLLPVLTEDNVAGPAPRDRSQPFWR